ncbi:MAG: TetR/AcrR family transcriptional regulator [Thermodesulfobacteriota bacterium]
MTNKDIILKTANDLFHSFGYSQTSVDKIIEQSGISKSNFYYHFKTKETLALQILDKLIHKYKDEVIYETLLEKNYNPLERLTRFFDKVICYHKTLSCRKGCPFGNLALEQSDINDKFRIKLSNFFSEWKIAIEDCIRAGVNENYFRENIDPASLADLILSQIEGSILLSKTHKAIDTLKNSCSQILKLIVKKEIQNE